MKKVLFALASVALAGLVSLASCSKDEPAGLKLDKTGNTISIAESFVLTASGVDAVEWSMDPADSKVASIAADGLKVTVTGLAAGTVNVVATANGVSKACEVTVVNADLEPVPAIEAPASDKVIVAIRVPAGTVCKGIGFVGTGAAELGADWAPNNGADFTQVEGTETWWAVTLSAAAEKTLADIKGKPVAYPEAGKEKAVWGTQWGKNTKEATNVIMMPETAAGPELGDPDNNGEPQIVNVGPGGNIIFIDVLAWQNLPCVPTNPAGHATFKLTANNLPAEAKFIGISGGDFADGSELGWLPAVAPLQMTQQADGTWTAEADVKAAFQYKYVWSADGTTWDWDHSQEEGANIQMALDLKANDTIEAWKGGAAAEPEVK